MFDKFRFRHVLAALEAARAGRVAGAADDAWVLGSPTLARLLLAHAVAGLCVRGEVTEAQLASGQLTPAPVTAMIAVGELADVALVSRALVRGGALLWFTNVPPHVVAGRVLAAGHCNIWQRAAGRQVLTVSTNLALTTAAALAPAA